MILEYQHSFLLILYENMSLCLRVCFNFILYVMSHFILLDEYNPYKYASIVWTYNFFQDLKALFKETKQEVHRVQLGWEKEIECLGEIQASVLHCLFLFLLMPVNMLTVYKKNSPYLVEYINIATMSLTGHHVKGLEVTASSYHKVLEENRHLYNQVQDLKGISEISFVTKSHTPVIC